MYSSDNVGMLLEYFAEGLDVRAVRFLKHDLVAQDL